MKLNDNESFLSVKSRNEEIAVFCRLLNESSSKIEKRASF